MTPDDPSPSHDDPAEREPSDPTQPRRPLLSRERGFPLAVAAVMLLSAIVCFAGLTGQPLEGHEILVIQTAREMHDRGDYIVPYFNGEPRLNKPPLSYWLTLAVASVTGKFGELEGRLPSALAAIGAIALTLWIGRALAGRWVALAAALLLASTIPFHNFAQNARPEMVYALLCTAMLALFLAARRAARRKRNTIPFAFGLWAAAALATLAKGPHLPAAFLIAFAILTLASPATRPLTRAIFRPVTGLMLMTAIALPWWLAIRSAIGSDTFADSELSGDRYQVNPLNLLEPDYLYGAAQMMLPWAALIPVALLIIWRGGRSGLLARRLAVIVAISILLLGFGGDKRPYYLLPLTPVFALILALSARAMWNWAVALNRRAARKPLPVIGLLHVVVAAAFCPFLIFERSFDAAPVEALIISAAAAGILALGITLLLVSRRGSAARAARFEWTLPPAAFALTLVGASASGLIALPSRVNQASVAQWIEHHAPADRPVYTFDCDPVLLAFYARRPIRELPMTSADDRIAADLDPDGATLVTPTDRLDEIASLGLTYQTLHVQPDCEDDLEWTVLAVTEPRHPTPASNLPAAVHGTSP